MQQQQDLLPSDMLSSPLPDPSSPTPLLTHRNNSQQRLESHDETQHQHQQPNLPRTKSNLSTLDLIRDSGLQKLPPGFGSFALLAESRRASNSAKMPISLSFRRKDIFVQLSIIFGLVLLGIVIYEFVALFALETQGVTSNWLLSLLILQVGSFYLCLLAFIYANEAGDVRNYKMTIFAGVLNTSAFLLRVILAFGFRDFESNEIVY